MSCVKEPKQKNISDDYLKTLEEVKKQYQQYVEVSELYKLPIQKEEETRTISASQPGTSPDDKYNSHQVKTEQRWLHGANF